MGSNWDRGIDSIRLRNMSHVKVCHCFLKRRFRWSHVAKQCIQQRTSCADLAWSVCVVFVRVKSYSSYHRFIIVNTIGAVTSIRLDVCSWWPWHTLSAVLMTVVVAMVWVYQRNNVIWRGLTMGRVCHRQIHGPTSGILPLNWLKFL